MSDFVVSARKYRPSTFASVVGQEALTTTLKNAILQNKLSHAYLFCGPRGVGKTSCARIFAKTINCQNRTPEGEACNECESCKAANEGRSMNIFELDAASNNSVDNIRQITEQVYVAPTDGRYRVYIIDEVHMLSSSAFNAFLKTLEEPPAHAIFILATTEKNKVLPTIISRCQVHDFNRITPEDIARHLAYVAESEHIEADPEALRMIAGTADGGMRDALSMFDQIAGFGNGIITKAGVRSNLNLLDEDEYFALLAYTLQGKHTKVLTLVDSLLGRGYEGDVIMRGFSNFLRNVLLSQSPETIDLVEAPDSTKKRLQKAGGYAKTSLLWEFLKISTAFGAQYKNNSEKRLALEVALLKMAEKNPESPLSMPLDEIVRTPQVEDPKPAPEPEPKPLTRPVQAPATAAPEPAPVAAPTPKTVTPRPIQTPKPEPTPGVSRAMTSMSFNVMTGKSGGQEDEEEETEEAPGERDVPFQIEDLKKAWQKYADGLDPKQKMLVKEQLFRFYPKETDEPYHFEVLADSDTVKRQIEEEYPRMKRFLSNELRNDLFQIDVKTVKRDQEVLPKSPSEKLSYLSHKNANLARISEELGLLALN